MRPVATASLFTAALLLAGAGAASPTSQARSFVGANLSPQAKITMSAAQAIALRARPGKVTDRELEKEAGGSGLRYSFDVKASGVTYEVGVDARTGKVLENGKEGPNPD